MSKTFLFFSAQYLPTTGGVERYTYNLATRLIALGHRAVVVTSQLPGLPEQEQDPSGIEVIRVPSWLLMGGRLPVVRPGKGLSRAMEQLWQRRIDCCVINTYFYPLSIYAAFATRARKIPTIVINHGSAWLMTGSRILEFAGQVYEHIAARLARMGCRRFFGVSQISRDWMNTFSIPAEGVITNAIDPDAVEAACETGLDWRRELGLPENARIVAFVGRMVPEKGVGALIEAMKTIRQQVPEAVLVMAGSGPLWESYRPNPPEGVYLPGNQSYGRTLALLKQADLFCLPSRSEGFACTVLEAAAMGCPVVTTATGGSPQLILDARYGTLLPDAGAQTIARCCVTGLRDEVWRRSAAELAKRQLMENFTWDHAVRQLLAAFGENP